jgi:hypothetical protein
MTSHMAATREVLTPFGANKHAEELLASPPCRNGKTGVTGKIRRKTNKRHSGSIPSGQRTQGCPRLGMPARTSSDIPEIK